MSIDTLIVYITVSFFYIISPGPAVFLAMANSVEGDLKAVTLSSLGNVFGLFLLSAISIIGLGALILTSATLFLIVKVVGAAYLAYLGFKQFKVAKALSSLGEVTVKALNNSGEVTVKAKEKSSTSYFTEGFTLAATNPKPILFFIAIFPQFLNVNVALVPQFFVLTIIFMVISFLSLLSYGYLAKSAKNIFLNKTGMQWFHRITGGLFVGISVGLLQLKSVNS